MSSDEALCYQIAPTTKSIGEKQKEETHVLWPNWGTAFFEKLANELRGYDRPRGPETKSPKKTPTAPKVVKKYVILYETRSTKNEVVVLLCTNVFC